MKRDYRRPSHEIFSPSSSQHLYIQHAIIEHVYLCVALSVIWDKKL